MTTTISRHAADRPVRRPGTLLAASAALLFGSTLAATGASAMSHGTDAPAGTAPWMATLAFSGTEPLVKRASCGGTLIAPDRVLTAGHCVRGTPPSDFEVYLGADRLSQHEAAHEVRGWFWHPGWRQINTPDGIFAANDLAVVVLDQPVRDVDPVPIASAEEVAGAVAQGDTGMVYGHGITEKTDPKKGAMTDRLQQGRMKLLPPEQCDPRIPDDSVGTSGFCTTGVPPSPGAPTPSVCGGDSGGPLMLSTPDGIRVAAVLSASSGSVCDGTVLQGEFMNAAEWQEHALSPNPDLAPTGTMHVTGTPAVGERLEATVRSLTPKDATVEYAWYEEKDDGDGFRYYVPIEGATESSFTIPERLAGRRLEVIATLSTPGGEVMASKMIEPVKQ